MIWGKEIFTVIVKDGTITTHLLIVAVNGLCIEEIEGRTFNLNLYNTQTVSFNGDLICGFWFIDQ